MYILFTMSSDPINCSSAAEVLENFGAVYEVAETGLSDDQFTAKIAGLEIGEAVNFTHDEDVYASVVRIAKLTSIEDESTDDDVEIEEEEEE